MNDYIILNKYKDATLNMLQYSFPQIPIEELSRAVDYSINKRLTDHNAKINNNYTNKEIEISIMEMTEYILSRKPILTAYGVLYQQKGTVPNPITQRIKGFMEDRDKLKKEMFKYPKGSEEREKYNLYQLLKKLDANGFYGLFGQSSCLFFNIYVATSITTQGRSLISSAGMFFEMFLSNSVKFGSFDEVITFINNIVNEKNERKYKDSQLLDRNITVEECFSKIMYSCGFNYVPEEDEMDILWDILVNLNQEDINRIYYKNNLYEFMDNKSMQKAIIIMLKSLEAPFMIPNAKNIPKEIVAELNEFCDILMEFVYYHHQIIDHYSKIDNMIRSSSVLLDTDSSLVSLDAWYRYCLDLIKDVDIPIKHTCVDPFVEIECDEFGDFDLKKALIKIDTEVEYNFYDEESIEFDKLINPMVEIPQDGVRYSIINIMAYCLDVMINDYMIRYCKHSFSDVEGEPCLIKMKNEYLFKRLLLTSADKFYADIQEIQEGTIIPKDKALDIKGLPLTKSTLNVASQERLKKILYEDILNADYIDQVKIMKKLAIFEKEIYNSLSNGEKKFYKPVSIKSISSYDDPMKIAGIKGSIVYNELRDPDMPAIDLYGGKQNLDLIKLVINKSNLPEIEREHPDKYNKIIELMKSAKQFEKGIDAIAVPKSESTPKWLLKYIDYSTLLSDNLKNLPIESVGVSRGQDTNPYTNILKLV